MAIPDEYWVNRRFYLHPPQYPGQTEYTIYSFPGGAVRDHISHPNPDIAYSRAWARFCELQREAWDDHDQQLTLGGFNDTRASNDK